MYCIIVNVFMPALRLVLLCGWKPCTVCDKHVLYIVTVSISTIYHYNRAILAFPPVIILTYNSTTIYMYCNTCVIRIMESGAPGQLH